MASKKPEHKGASEQGCHYGFIDAFKKAHPIASDIVVITVGVCSVLGFLLTVIAVAFPDILSGLSEAMLDGSVMASLAAIVRHIAVQANQAFPVCFGAWCVIAAVFAFSSLCDNRHAKRDVETAKVSWNYFFNTFAFLALMLALYGANRAFGAPYLFGISLTGVGLAAFEVLLALGAGIVIVARLRLGKSWELGVSINDAEPPLMTKGAYSHVRHPLYGGLDLMYIATALMLFGGNYVAIAISTAAIAVNCVRARREDRILVSKYGDLWRKYASETPFMFPALHPLAK